MQNIKILEGVQLILGVCVNLSHATNISKNAWYKFCAINWLTRQKTCKFFCFNTRSPEKFLYLQGRVRSIFCIHL